MLSTVSSLSAETFIDSSLTIFTVALFLLSEGFVSPDFVAVSSDVDFSISCILCLFIVHLHAYVDLFAGAFFF